MWQPVGFVILVLGAALTIPIGAWVIAKSRLPSWARGIWKWPLGGNVSPEVAGLQGWSALLVGVAALLTLTPLVRLPERDLTSLAALSVALLFLLVAVGAYVRSVVLSHRAAAGPSGSGPAMRRGTALAVGMVAGLAMGALITAGVSDAFLGGPASTNQATPTPRADGLQWTDVKVGKGTAAAGGKVLTVQYTLWLANGTRIDSSADHGNQFTFTLGKGEVIKGFDEGVTGMRVGGIRWLTIPPLSPTAPRVPPRRLVRASLRTRHSCSWSN